MAVHWQIKFKSLRADTLYTVSIYDASFSGTPVQLVGAAEPFVTQEENDDDPFVPVRTQTGNLTIVDTGEDMAGNDFDWRDLIPSDATARKVTLTAGGKVKWSGYIQPQTFSGAWVPPPIERTFPVFCQLGVLDGMEVAPNGGDIENVAYILYYILTIASTNLFQKVYFSGSDAVSEWLTKRVQWVNFIQYDDQGQPKSKYNALALLEEICTFFGWTLRTHGEDLYFSSGDEDFDVAWQQIDIQDLRDIGEGHTITPTTISTWDELQLATSDYANADGMETIGRGWVKTIVTADINPLKDVISVPYDEIAEDYRGQSSEGTNYGTDKWYFKKNSNPYGIGQSWTKNGITLSLKGGNPADGASFDIYEYYDGVLGYKADYNWSKKITLYNGNSLNDLMILETENAYAFSNGVLTFNAIVFQDIITGGEHKRYNASGKLYFKIKIGNLWWDPDTSQWTMNEPTAYEILYIGNDQLTEEEGEGKILSNSYVGTYSGGVYTDNPLGTWKGYGFGITNAIGGKIHVEIDKFQLDNQHGVTNGPALADFTIGFTRYKTYAKNSDRSENTYRATNASDFGGEKNVRTIFASDKNNAAGLGLLLNDDLTYCEELTYSMDGGGGQEHPEQHLANRLSLFGSKTHFKYDLALRTDRVDVTPLKRFEVFNSGSRFCYPISISHNWRDDETRVILIEQ